MKAECFQPAWETRMQPECLRIRGEGKERKEGFYRDKKSRDANAPRLS
ncbi:hypothetical protein NITGR_280111 [Nitrospina gracilis 3/211]|uniref:Uncharacterized protein n=1 Tax=Nitrospina gracilis (strain 3/211) TaxID=1266370 RepID=M1ZAT1_NITG3|nr:hypothetical protein NITGR_280111 [Nitrospina gracilis 3/211]